MDVEQARDGVRVECAGQLAAGLGRPHRGGRILIGQPLAHQPAVEAAHCRQQALNAAGAQALAVQARDEAANLVFADLRRVAEIQARQLLGKPLEVAPIG